MKFSQIIEDNVRNVENETGSLHLVFFKKALCEKQVVTTLVSIYFGSLQLGHTIKTNCIKFQTVDPKIFLILNFRNGPGTSFFTKFICIVIICFPVCDVINFENNISFLNKLFFLMTKKARQKF